MCALCFMANFGEFQLAGIVGRVSQAFGLSALQFALCLFAPYLVNFVLGIPMGLLADRFGAKLIGAMVVVVSGAALIGRAYASSGFTSLFVWMMLFGLSMVYVNALGAKILGAWFKAQDLSVAMGLFVGCAGLGVGCGEATASLFSTLTGTFTLSWVLFAGVMCAFLVGFKSKRLEARPIRPQSALRFFAVAARNRYVWLAGVAVLCLFSGLVSASGNLPDALTRAKRVSPLAAGLLGLPLGIGGALGSFLVPFVVRDVRRIKVWLAAFVGVGAALELAALVVPFGPLTWVCVFVGAFLTNGMLPLLVPFPIMLSEIGTTYGGSAGGIVSLLQTAGGFFIPTFGVARLARLGPIATFVAIFALFVLAAAVGLGLPERGFRRSPSGA